MADQSKYIEHVFLTIPHATCLDYLVGRLSCDYAAEKVARILESRLMDTKRFITWVFRADLPRAVVDANRFAGRYFVSMRSLLQQAYVKFAKKTIAVLDIHTFPYTKEEWRAYEIVLLDAERHTGGLGQYLYNKLSNAKVKIARYEVSVVNDIMDEALALGHAAVLIEFNELLLTDKRSEELAKLIAAALSEYTVKM